MADEVTDRGKMIAAISYGGFFFGFPLGIVPLVMRDDAFALEHGKHATAVWLLHFTMVMVLTFVVTAIATVTCGFGAILYPLILVPALAGMGTSVHGLILALNGDASEPFGGMGLGNMLFSSIEVDEAAVAKLAAAASKAPAKAAPEEAEEVAVAEEAPVEEAPAEEAPVEEAPAPEPAPDEAATVVDASPVPPPPPPPSAPGPVPDDADQTTDGGDVPPPPPPAPPPVDASDVPPPPPVPPPVDASDAPPPPPLPPKSE